MITFKTLFQVAGQASAAAPGRVNLMGEHTDYNQGWVLPTVLTEQTMVTLAIVSEPSNQLDAFSTHFQERTQRWMSSTITAHWTDYLVACIQQLQNRQITVPSLKVLVESTIPIGAGVSSSAALEVAFLKALRALLKLNISDIDLALIAHQAESEGVGMPCGVMDQIVCTLGRSGEALFLDTQDLTMEYIPLPTSHTFAVVNSGKTHQLASSDYKTRRQECSKAANLLNVANLRAINAEDISSDDFQSLPKKFQQRVMHVVTENQRVLAGVSALQQNRINDFGGLMNASHLSQKTDFSVTIPETDVLCDIAIEQGAIGARQTGGGFGGAIVALVPKATAQTWWDAVAHLCTAVSLIGYTPDP